MTINEIAKLAGVSASTVSKIINKKDSSISKETRERILKIVQEYNYTPYSSIISNKKTWTIGVILNNDNYYNKIIDGIIQYAQQKGYNILVCNSFNNEEQELKNLTNFYNINIDGIIWQPLNENSIKNYNNILNKKIPYIIFENYFIKDCFNLPFNDYAYNITKKLINKNHTKIACLIDNEPFKENFLKGYKKCLFDNHINLDNTLIFNDFSENLLYKINNNEITSIIFSNYNKALEFYYFMNSLQYKIPKDFSIISLKTDLTNSIKFPQICTLTINTKDFGNYLCNKIINKIENIKDNKENFINNFSLDNNFTISNPYSMNLEKIIVVGSINIDTYLNVNNFPDTSKTVTSSTSFTCPGGKALNQSIGIAKLGHKPILLGKVGYDLEANTIYETLNDYNIENFYVTRCKENHTGKAYIFVKDNGDSMISILNGANYNLTPKDIIKQENLFKNVKYCLIPSEIPLDTVKETLNISYKNNVKTIFKPSGFSYISKEILEKINIIVANEEELFEICPKNYNSIEEKANYMLNCGIETVIITLKERGCYVKTTHFEKYFNAINILSIDKTGASDAFISALVSYLLYGYDLIKSITIATYAAAFCISREGVIPALIDKNSLETFINKKEPYLLKR